ncbi:hypothetical protein BDV28DRAFT_129127, partial [Aspergillus coremiiformis]
MVSWDVQISPSAIFVSSSLQKHGSPDDIRTKGLGISMLTPFRCCCCCCCCCCVFFFLLSVLIH